MTRGWLVLLLWALALAAAPVRAEPGATVVFIASERLTDLTLGYRHFAQVARLGFGTPQKPWHAWFGGGTDVRPLVHLPSYQPGQSVRLQAPMLLGNRFNGKPWDSGFAALASFDLDGNGIVEGRELNDLYVWVDFDGDGTLAPREDALRPASFYYTAFDLRAGAKPAKGQARDARMLAFSVLVPYATRIHLLELDVSDSFATRHEGYLPRSAAGSRGAPDASHPLTGWWRWRVTNAEQWIDRTRPWGAEAGGELMLAVQQNRVQGVLRFVGPHEDRINLPLDGSWHNGKAQWTSVSPLGLTRSEVRLESLYGRPVLRARAFSNRNGKVQEWTWEARYEKPLD